MTRVGVHAKSAPLIERGRNQMAQHRNFRLGAARSRLPPVRQIPPLFSWRCGGFSVVLLEQSAFATNEGRVLQLVIDAVHLLAVEFNVHGTAIRNQFKVKHALKLPPDANHHLLTKTTLTPNCWRILILRNPLLLPVVIDQVDPFFVRSHNTSPKPIIQWIFQRLTADFNTTLGLRFDQLVWILAGHLVHEIRLMQVTDQSDGTRLQEPTPIHGCSMRSHLPRLPADLRCPTLMAGRNVVDLRD